MRLIGLHGKAGSGKDTAAFLGLKDYKKLAFATPLKKAAIELYNLTDDQVNGNLKETVDTRWNKSPRKILQELGDFCRKDNPRFFINLMKIKIDELLKSGIKNIVITDVRYDNEARFIEELGGKIIEITRNIGSIQNKDLATHMSEQRLSAKYIKHVIENNGSFQDLADCIKKLEKIGNI